MKLLLQKEIEKKIKLKYAVINYLKNFLDTSNSTGKNETKWNSIILGVTCIGLFVVSLTIGIARGVGVTFDFFIMFISNEEIQYLEKHFKTIEKIS